MPKIVAKALLAERCRVVLADADAMAMKHQWEKDETTSSEQHNAIIVPCNVTDPYQVQCLIHQADDFAQSGAPDAAGASTAAASLLVNCAGITRDSWISKMNLEDWEKVVDVNLKGTFLTCRYFLDQERIQRLSSISSSSSSSLSIVNIGSIVSEHGNLGQVNYAASKGGVVGLTRALAKEMASRRRSSPSSSASSLPSVPTIRVNAVLPGFIDTPMTRAVPDPVQQSVIVPKFPWGDLELLTKSPMSCPFYSPLDLLILRENVFVSVA